MQFKIFPDWQKVKNFYCQERQLRKPFLWGHQELKMARFLDAHNALKTFLKDTMEDKHMFLDSTTPAEKQ